MSLLAGRKPFMALLFMATLGVTLASLPARAVTMERLAGWWLAIDGTFPVLWERGIIIAMEEFLIIGEDGSIEDRVVHLSRVTIDERDCQTHGWCSNAPVIARARAAIQDDRLLVADQREDPGPVDNREVDAYIRRAAVTATPSWMFQLEEEGRRLRLRSSGMRDVTRTLVKVSPDRMRRLRAGFLFSELSAMQYWRCYLAKASAGDPAFAPIHRVGRAPPPFLEDYLRGASYLASNEAKLMRPTPDDPELERRKLADVVVEDLMTENFDDLRRAKSVSDAKPLWARARYIRTRLLGDSAAKADAALRQMMQGEMVKVSLSEAEIAALRRVVKGDRESRELFCR